MGGEGGADATTAGSGGAAPSLVPAVDVDGVLAAVAAVGPPPPPPRRRWLGLPSSSQPPPAPGPTSRAAYVEALSCAIGEALLVHGVAVPPSALAVAPATGALALITPAAARHVPRPLRRRLCAYYLAAATGHAPATAHAFGATGVALGGGGGTRRLGDAAFDAVGVAAAGVLDTGALPAGAAAAAARVLWGRVAAVAPPLVGVVAAVGELRGLAGVGGGRGRPFGTLVRRSALRGMREGEGGWGEWPEEA